MERSAANCEKSSKADSSKERTSRIRPVEENDRMVEIDPIRGLVQQSGCGGCGPSLESMALGMASMPVAQRRQAALSLQRSRGNRFVQRMAMAAQVPVQTKREPNRTGMPDGLKDGIESISRTDTYPISSKSTHLTEYAFRRNIKLAGESQSKMPESPPIQLMLACYTFSDLGLPAPPVPGALFLNETIAFVRYARTGNLIYTLADGDNIGIIKHYVPSNWISENLIDKCIQFRTRGNVMLQLTGILIAMGLPIPILRGFNRVEFDSWVDEAVDSICNWQQNLFRHSTSSGDHGGTTLDIPTDLVVYARVTAAAAVMAPFGLNTRPIH